MGTKTKYTFLIINRNITARFLKTLPEFLAKALQTSMVGMGKMGEDTRQLFAVPALVSDSMCSNPDSNELNDTGLVPSCLQRLSLLICKTGIRAVAPRCCCGNKII